MNGAKKMNFLTRNTEVKKNVCSKEKHLGAFTRTIHL